MDETLAASLCPFRCPPCGWKALPNRDATIEFSRHLWWRICWAETGVLMRVLVGGVSRYRRRDVDRLIDGIAGDRA